MKAIVVFAWCLAACQGQQKPASSAGSGGKPASGTAGAAAPATAIGKIKDATYSLPQKEILKDEPSKVFMKLSGGTPRRAVHVTAGLCTEIECPPMEEAPWLARKDELRGQMPILIQQRPDTVFELGTTTMDGMPVLFLYWLGVERSDQGMTAAHAFRVFWNDGKHVFIIDSKDGERVQPELDTPAKLGTRIPRAELEKTAADILRTMRLQLK